MVAITVGELLSESRDALGRGGTARLDSEVLLGHLLGVDRAWLFANSEHTVGERETAAFRGLVHRRATGEPVAYLTGVREFWSLQLAVTPDVLIPRPETEHLVESVLEFVPVDARWRIADLGTGSGAVALAIAVERPGCEIHATDTSPAALQVARGNAERLLPGRIRFHEGSWCAPLDGSLRVIVSNPPYVEAGDPHLSQGDCRFEPRAALTPGADGLAAIRCIASEGLERLEPGGLLALEHGFDQAEAVRGILESAGFVRVRTKSDLQGLERVTVGIAPASDDG
jgi:release factor glutamine methyltransferase